MSGTDPVIEITEADTSPPGGVTQEFREIVGLALKTTDPDVLEAAEQDFRGVYRSIGDYVREQLAEHLPLHMGWLLDCCDPAKLRAGYENDTVRIWTIALSDEWVLLFVSQWELGRRRLRESP